MAAMMGLRPSALLVFTVVLLFGSVTAFVGPPEMFMMGDPTISNRRTLSPGSPPFLIRSPFYKYDSYLSGDISSIVLESGPDPLVLTFKFRHFYLEPGGACVFDYLCIHGVKFCGGVENGRIISFILPENSQTTVIFRSDWYHEYSGFDLLVTTQLATNTTWVFEPRGSGEAARTIYYKNVTYSPDMPYTDTCSNITKVYEICHHIIDYTMTNNKNTPAFYGVRIDASTRPFIIHSYYWLKEKNLQSSIRECSMVLQSGPEPLILSFNYRVFSMESSQDCKTTYLCVNGVKFCGQWTKSFVHENILPAKKELTIYYKKGSSVRTFIEIIVTPRRAVEKEVVTEVVAYNAKLNTPIKTEQVFSSEMPYQDRCRAKPRFEFHTLCYVRGSQVVRIRPDSQPFIVLSPIYGSGKRTSDCFLALETGPEPVILVFKFLKFKLRTEKNCSFEFLCIHGTTYCSSWPAGRRTSHILPENSKSTIIFKSQLAQEWYDFQILVTPLPITAAGSLIEQRGVADEIHDLAFVNVTYTPGMHYIDLCSIKQNNTPYVLCEPGHSDKLAVSSKSSPLVILSPNYGNDDYFGTCVLELNSQDDPLVLNFNFKKFQLKNTSNCAVDNICIHGVSFCNDWMTERQLSYIIPPNSRSTVVLHTVPPRDISGFEIHLTTELANEDTTVSEPGGYGESESRFLLHTANYNPEKAYIDFCSVKRGYTLCDTNKPNVVKLSKENELFFIRSPARGGDQEESVCALVLESGDTPLVLTYYFRTIQLGIPDSCSSNSLCIHGVSFCNDLMNGREVSYILPENRNSTVYFQTVGGERSDFDIYVRVQEAADGQQVLEPRALRTSGGNFSLLNVTYRPGMPYVDFCNHSNRTLDEYYLSSRSQLVKVGPQTPPFYIYSQKDSSGHYTMGTYHWLTLEAGPEPLVVIVYFSEFDVEYDDNCSLDFLCIHGVKFCGAMGELNGQLTSHILPEYKTSTILFTSDFSVVKRGFVIQVFVERADNTTRVSEGQGYWNDEWGPDSQLVNYSVGMPYNDSCIAIKRDYEICHPDGQEVKLDPSNRPFIIRSPDWIKNGKAISRSCSLTLVNGQEDLNLFLEYRYLSIERSRNCSDNYLCVNGVRFCGNWTNGKSWDNYLPRKKTLTISYTQSNDSRQSCFEIIVRPKRISKYQQLKEVVAYTPGNNSVFEETYFPPMSYEDRCPALVDRMPVYILCDLNGPDVLKVDSNTKPFIIVSPSYGIHYQHRQRFCSLVIESGPEPLVLTFKVKSLKWNPGRSTSRNFFCVNSVSYFGQEGVDTEYGQILPENRRSTVFYEIYDTKNTPVFQIHVGIKQATTGSDVLEPRFYANKFVLHRPMRYSRDMIYVDACALQHSHTMELLYNKPQILQVTPDSPICVIKSAPPKSPSDINSTLVLESGRDPLLLTFYFRLFRMSDTNCSNNYLCIHGLRLCSFYEGEFFSHILPENSKSTIVFKQNFPFYVGKYEISMHVQRATNETLVREGHGFLGGLKKVWYDVVKYVPGMQYNDFCANSYFTEVYELCSTNILNINASTRPFIIEYSVGTHDYNINRHCHLLVRAGTEPLVLTLTYRKLHIPFSYECKRYYLCVSGVKFCSYWQTTREFTHILPENGTFSFVFHTKHTYYYTPKVEIYVTTRRAVNNEVVKEVTKFDSSRETFEFENVTYRPGMYYNDSCYHLHSSTLTKPPTASTERATTPTELPSTPTELPSTPTELPATPIELPATPTEGPTTYTEPVTEVYPLCLKSDVNINASTLPFVTLDTINRSSVDTHCILHLKAETEPLDLALSHRKFTVPFSPECKSDYLCLNRDKLCSNRSATLVRSYSLPDTRTFAFYFKTNIYYSNTHVEIDVSTRSAVSNEVVKEVTKYNPITDTFEFENLAYRPEVYYNGSCYHLHISTITKQITASTEGPTTQNEHSTAATERPTTSTELATAPTELLTTPNEVLTTPTELLTTPTELLTTPTEGPTKSTEPIPDVYNMCQPDNYTLVMVNASTEPVIVQNPNWSKVMYDTSLNCTLVLRSVNHPLILTLNYRKFSLERSNECADGFVGVNLIKLCGKWETPREFTHLLLPNTSFNFTFLTQRNRLRFSYFEILVTPRLAVNGEAIMELSKYNPMNDHFEYQTVTYHPVIPLHDNSTTEMKTTTTVKTKGPKKATKKPKKVTKKPKKVNQKPKKVTKKPKKATKRPQKATKLSITTTKVPNAAP